MSAFFHSLRWRLQAWHGLLLFLVVSGSAIPAYHLVSENQMQLIDRDLMIQERLLVRSMMDAVQGTLPLPSGRAPNPVRPFMIVPSDLIQRLHLQPVKLPDNVISQFHGREPGYAYFSIRDRDDKVLLQSDNVPTDLAFLAIPNSEMAEDTRSVGQRREIRRSSVHGLKVIVGRDITPDLEEMQRMSWLHFLFGFGIWFFGLLGGWWLSGRAIRPIETISQTASRIAEGNLRQRIDIQETDSELGQLSRVLNQTFERLHDAFERQRQFTADASHELRTPITILLSETQRILKRERSPEEYREALETCGTTAQRMRRLVEALLLLARQENNDSQAHLEACDLSIILQDAIQHLSPLAQERGLKIKSNLSSVRCFADAGAMTILATNLIANALQHGGNVSVSCALQNQQPTFTVRDDGPGIAETDLPHIFERFYRADQARTGTSGHTGLGLAIAKAIVENHHGTIHVTSGQGACFEVRLPIVS